MKTYRIKKLADAAGITVRTLQHYDEIGLLKPHRRKENNYRVYGDLERLRLQQILFYKELGYELEAIQEILDKPGFDLEASLQKQKTELKAKKKRLSMLITTLDHTLTNLNNVNTMTNNELYEGFPEGKKYRDEAIQSWGDEVKKTEERIKKMGKERWKEVQVEGDAITKKLADLADLSPQSLEVQKAIGLLHRHLENFYPVPEERLRGLGQMYVSDDRFRAHYDKYKEGLAEFINQAIQVYCDRGMKA